MTHGRRAACGMALCALLGVGVSGVHAQPGKQAASDVSLGLSPGRPRVRPVRVDTPPVIDGRLDDEAWQSAAVLTTFVQQSPLEGAPAT